VTTFPYDALQAAVTRLDEEPLGDREMSLRTGISERTIRDVKHVGITDPYLADKMAVAAGLLPGDVWGWSLWNDSFFDESDEGDDGYFADDPAMIDLADEPLGAPQYHRAP
jgi:hypothetical protein